MQDHTPDPEKRSTTRTGTRNRRSRASAKKAGTAFETSTAAYLAKTLQDDRIERRARNGNQDRGDIAGVRIRGRRVVIECKDYGGQIKPGPWLKEAETEAGNDDADIGIVIAKRRGTTDPDEQYVLMTVRDLLYLFGAYD